MFTNTCPSMQYVRGPARGTFNQSWKRSGDKCAHEWGSIQLPCGGRNLIHRIPYATPVAVEYDTGDYVATMDKLERSRFRRFDATPQSVRGKGQAARLLGETLQSSMRIAPSETSIGQLAAGGSV